MRASRHKRRPAAGRALLRPLVIAAIAVVAVPQRAQAQNYPWCSNFADGAGTNCGFSTYAQCMAEIAGAGGYCDRNNLYQPPAAAAPEERKLHRTQSRKTS